MLNTKRRFAIIEGDIAKVPLGEGAKDGYALVDSGFSWIEKHSWFPCHGYAIATINGQKVFMHHLIAGHPTRGLVVDHINRDRLDNRKDNLRFVTHKQNLRNRGDNKNSTSGLKGVYLNKKNNQWDTRIRVDGKLLYLGTFADKAEASRAYTNAARKYFS